MKVFPMLTVKEGTTRTGKQTIYLQYRNVQYFDSQTRYAHMA